MNESPLSTTPKPALAAGAVHVHCFALDLDPPVLNNLHKTLGEDEQHRAARFQGESTRRRFIAAHGQTREILGSYLQLSPDLVRFGHGAYGKPCLHSGTLCFNLSHSDGMGLLAVTLAAEVGVDIERIRPFPNFQDIAKRWFSPQEISTLFALAGEQRLGAFFSCWTRKESYLKALGTGLSSRISQCTVSLAPGDPARLLEAVDDNMNWSMIDLACIPGYRAALTVEGNVASLSFHWHGITGVADS